MAEQNLHSEEFVGRTLADVLPTEYASFIAPHVRGALAGEEREFEIEIPHGCYEVHVAPLRGEDARTIGAVAVGRDVSALRQARRSLEERARELERSNAELAEFASIASHDLAEPLRTITGYLQLLRRRFGDELSGEADEYVLAAIASADRLRALIDDVLAYSRAGRSERPAEPVDMERVVAAVAESVAAAIEWDRLPTVPGEERQLFQLMQNLVSNGVKFVAAGTEPRVRITATRESAEWQFAVDDNGIGIEPGHAERIFGMFQRLHARDSYPGTGIGLAIARKVVEHHGGRIWAEPRPEGGTRMLFTLPGQAGRSSS